MSRWLVGVCNLCERGAFVEGIGAETLVLDQCVDRLVGWRQAAIVGLIRLVVE